MASTLQASPARPRAAALRQKAAPHAVPRKPAPRRALAKAPALGKAELVARAEFRHQLRRFERFGEEEARKQGITWPQYLLLLQVSGMPERDWALIGELADRLQLEQHSTVGLVTRCELSGLVQRRRSEVDRRQVQVHLTPAGTRVMMRIAAAHKEELAALVQQLKNATRARAR